jgi:hypothetical protein
LEQGENEKMPGKIAIHCLLRVKVLKGITILSLFAATFALLILFIPASTGEIIAASLCGEGSAPDYGFTTDLQQAHWTVDWQDYVSESTVIEVDSILDRLDWDSIAQTMILFKPQNETGNRVNCAVHFLRYMKLGLVAGERKDNGFVFLIVVEPARIDVHYGVGLGLPALTAPELTALNRAAEETYQSTNSMDQALLTLVQGFDKMARKNYTPLVYPSQTPQATNLPSLPAGPLGILTVCGLLCIGTLIVLFLVWLFIQMARMGITFRPFSGSGFPRMGSPSGWNSPRTRGGSGSGRSGRGN